MSVLDTFSLKDRVVVITGATSGIGRALAVACAEAGATVAAIGRNQAKLDELSKELSQFDRPHFFLSFDVTEYDKIPELIDQIVKRCGKISGFVHSAGITATIPLRAMSAENYNDIFQTNVVAGFELIKTISLKKYLSENASFLMISSVSALRGEPGLLAYASSKGAILSGIKTLAKELAAKKIRVNALIPGQMIDTKMGQATVDTLPDDALQALKKQHALGWGNVNSVTGPAVFLLSDAAWWITGAALNVDGGYCL